MKPSDLNLPPKFPAWRSIDGRRTQYDIVVDVAASDKRFSILNAPTGVGKSAITMGLASLVGGRTLFLTESRHLQNQLYTDFAPMGLVEIKGQANYDCRYFDDGIRVNLPGCDEGPCHAGISCALKKGGCYYFDAVRRAAAHRLVVANYAYWMTIRKYAEPSVIGPFDTLILDEAHEAAATLSDFVRVHIERRQIERLLGFPTLRGASVAEWVEWAVEALRICKRRLERARDTVSLFHESISTVRRLMEVEGELSDLVSAHTWRRVDSPDLPAWTPGTATDWIVEESPKEVVFQPVWASGYAEQYLFGGIKRVVLVSATVTEKDARFLGLIPGSYSYHQYPSPFKHTIRPVYSVPTARVGRNMTVGEERIWVRRIDEIIRKECVNKRRKGIIHARSYERAKRIFALSEHKDLLVIHDSKTTRDTVRQFKDSKRPCVLLSPAVSTGHDFPMDECRFQIVAKLPFMDSRPALIQARIKSDKRYMDYVTLQELIQMCGRGVRSDADFCNTYIIDDNFRDWFWPRNRKWAPRWFRAGVKHVESISKVS